MAKSKLQQLASLTEGEFRTKVAIPLLQRMNYTNVRDTHGTDEFGKDIVCQYATPGQTFNIAVVIKKGDLSGSTTPRQGVHLLSVLREQVRQAHTIPVDDVETKSLRSIGNVIVWVSGKITSNAKHQVTHDRANTYVNMDFWDGPKTVEMLDEHYPEYWTIGDHAIVTYYSNAREKHSRLEDILALGSVHAEYRLPNVFVPPRLVRIEKIRSKQAKQERRPLKQYTFAELLKPSNDNTVMIGDLGTGKSTALRRMLIKTIDTNEQQSRRYPIPIYIRFRDLNFAIDSPITDALCVEFERLTPSGDATDIIGLLTDGKVLVLIDGLDELESDDRIETALGLLNTFSLTYSDSRIVITSRSLEVLETTNVLTRFSMYRILHLNFVQVKTMIRKWFTDKIDEGEKLIREIMNPITFTTIPLTPLTMAMLAAVYRGNTRDLPANLTDLFDKYVGFALGQWDMNKGIEHQIEWRIKRNMLCELAWKLLQTNNRGMASKDIESVVEAKRNEIGLPFDSGALVTEIIERSGLLVPTENDLYMFKHYAFFSYFAGHQLSVQPDSMRLIAEHFYDMAWSKTIFFAFGIKYNDQSLLEYVIDNIPVPSANLLYYAVQLGMITQAAYYVPNGIKAHLIRRSLVSYVLAWDEMVGTLEELQETEQKQRKSRHVSQALLLHFFCVNVNMGLGSPILRLPLKTIADGIFNDGIAADEQRPFDQDAQVEWYAFFLAIACLNAIALHTFEQLLQSNMIRNPMLLACCELQGQVMLEMLPSDAEEKTQLQDLISLVRKRIKGRDNVIESLFDQSPNPIALLNPELAGSKQE